LGRARGDGRARRGGRARGEERARRGGRAREGRATEAALARASTRRRIPSRTASGSRRRISQHAVKEIWAGAPRTQARSRSRCIFAEGVSERTPRRRFVERRQSQQSLRRARQSLWTGVPTKERNLKVGSTSGSRASSGRMPSRSSKRRSKVDGSRGRPSCMVVRIKKRRRRGRIYSREQ
jgi:hypothetical protein